MHKHVLFRTLLGLTLLAAIDLGCEWAARRVHAPIPGNVLGMLLLALLLRTGVVPLRAVEAGADFLLKWLALLFVPAAVSVARYVGLFRGAIFGVVLVVVVTTALVLLVTGVAAQKLVERERGDA